MLFGFVPMSWAKLTICLASIAQWIRAVGFYPIGRGFESCWGRRRSRAVFSPEINQRKAARDYVLTSFVGEVFEDHIESLRERRWGVAPAPAHGGAEAWESTGMKHTAIKTVKTTALSTITGTIAIMALVIFATLMALFVAPLALATAGTLQFLTFSPVGPLFMIMAVMATMLAGIHVNKRRTEAGATA